MQKLFKERELGEKIILTKDMEATSPFGDVDIIPKGTICLNYGVPSPASEYDNSYIELKLINPIRKGVAVIDRLVVKRNSKSIETYKEDSI
jgi:hypothetical protein